MAEGEAAQHKSRRQDGGIEPQRRPPVTAVDQASKYKPAGSTGKSRKRQRAAEAVIAAAERLKHGDAPSGGEADLDPAIGEVEPHGVRGRGISALRHRALDSRLVDVKERQ